LVVEKRISFKSDGLTIEGLLHLPANAHEGPGVPGVVVCHPHPLYGGSMYNVVVEALCKSLEASGFVALRFNFRGVGASEGSYDQGVGEVRDAKAALSFLKSISSPKVAKMGIAGYSFGAYVAAHAAVESPDVDALALISPPLALYDFGFLRAIRKPIFIALGDRDEFAGASIEELARIAASQARISLIEGADHFWFGREEEVCYAVTRFFEEVLKLGAQARRS